MTTLSRIDYVCSCKSCEDEAILSYTWPGCPARSICTKHILNAIQIANALGLPIDSLNIHALQGKLQEAIEFVVKHDISVRK